MDGTLTLPDGTELLLTAITLRTIKGRIEGTCRLAPGAGLSARQHARAEGQLHLADGRSATVRVGGVRPRQPVSNQEPMDVFHFQFVAGWD